MEPIISSWLQDCRTRGMADSSISSYLARLEYFQKFCGEKSILTADKFLIRTYIDMQRTKRIHPNTIAARLNALSNFYDYLIFENIRIDNPIHEIRKRYLHKYKTDSDSHEKRLLSVSEASRLIQCCIDPRDKAIFLTLFKTGIRRGELLSMEVQDIDFHNQSIMLKKHKKRSNRLVFFDAEVEYAISIYLQAREMRKPKSDRLWLTTYGKPLSGNGLHTMISRVLPLAGITDFSAHNCRHWFTTHLLRAGMRREHVQWLRGDMIKEAIDIYYHISPEDVRKSYLAYVPKLGI